MPPHSGSAVLPGMFRLHWPSDWPGVLIHRYASTSGTPVFAVGRSPRPRPGGLHQVCGSGLDTEGVQGPWPLRVGSITKRARWLFLVGGLAAESTLAAYHSSVRCQVL